MKTKYMMATVAEHITGDISRDTEDICIVSKQTKTNYIGNWVTGFGFANVEFPKKTTRKLTKDEIEKYHGMPLSMSGMVSFLNLKNEVFNKRICLTKDGVGTVFDGTLISPVKVGGMLYIINQSSGRTYQTSTIKSINGNSVNTKNSTYTIEYL